jgi:hypothetical protein
MNVEVNYGNHPTDRSRFSLSVKGTGIDDNNPEHMRRLSEWINRAVSDLYKIGNDLQDEHPARLVVKEEWEVNNG